MASIEDVNTGDLRLDADKPLAFVAMPFDVRLQAVYQRVVKPVLEGHGFQCIRADELLATGVIMQQIRALIERATIVFCDLTFDNPNVFYELGVAHTLNKPTILISQSPANIPFDVRHLRVLPYEDTKLGLLDLRDALVDTLNRVCPAKEKVPSVLPRREFLGFSEELEIQRTALFSNNVHFMRYAVRVLGELGDKESLKRIESIALSATDPDLIRDAFTALHVIDPDGTLPTLLENGLWSQREHLVRERVITLIGKYPPSDYLVTRVTQQMTDTSWGVRQAACEVLGRWGETLNESQLTKSAAALQNALADSQPEVRLAAAEGMRRLQEAREKKLAAKAEPVSEPPAANH